MKALALNASTAMEGRVGCAGVCSDVDPFFGRCKAKCQATSSMPASRR